VPGFQAAPFFGLFVPKETPKPIIAKLADALDKALDDQDARRRLHDLGADIPDKSKRGPDALRALVKSEIARLTPILQPHAVKPN
jgi:tripartite-type tricarboxylate transporter receptor subunit TctC